MPVRQEVLNVVLAQCLQDCGFISAPEQILRLPSDEVRLPDVIVDFHGLRLAIECEFSRNPPSASRRRAYDKAKERVEQAIAHIGIAVVYPARLRRVRFSRLKEELSRSELEYTVITEATVNPTSQLSLFPIDEDVSFSQGTVNDLGDALRRSYEQIVRDETVTIAVHRLEASMDACLSALGIQPATSVRMAEALGIHGLGQPERALNANQRNAVNRISALIIVNAMIFHEVLSQGQAAVHPLGQFRNSDTLVRDIEGHWYFILSEINYHPIFYVARELLGCFSADLSINRAMRELMDAALDIVRWRASLRHDLAGRIYHKILEEAKYLGAYYTSIPAAALLLKLALQPSHFQIDWSDVGALNELRIGDLACGTGTLLMAAADSVVDNHVRDCAVAQIQPNLDLLHETLIERIICGWDVLPSAIHLTASTLALRIPDRPIKTTNLVRVLHGGTEALLGSLELLGNRRAVATLFSPAQQMAGAGEVARQDVEPPLLDLCVMNPPFTSSRKGNRLFGSVPNRERTAMRERLRRIVREHHVPASITAGLGAVFVAMGDKYLKPSGVLALVLPRAVVSGIAWKKTRRLLSSRYNLRYMIASHEPSHWNFSENTSLSEVLLVARKLEEGERPVTQSTTRCVNLWRQPRTAIEALSLANAVVRTDTPNIMSHQGVGELRVNGNKLGELFEFSNQDLGGAHIGLCCSFAQTELVRCFLNLRLGRVQLPGQPALGDLPLCALGRIATLGPDPRDVYDGFDLSPGRTPFPTLWGHDTNAVRMMACSPNRFLTPLVASRPGRPLRRIDLLWPKAGRVLIAQRLRANTKRLTAVRMSERVLSDVWCPLSLLDTVPQQVQAEKSLVLWLNSTLGLILLLGHREETEGAWIQYKKPALAEMPVLDIARIEGRLLRRLSETYDALATRELLIFPEIEQDRCRIEIDECFQETLNLPDIGRLREILAREPILTQNTDGLA